jgi:hypothetical protein
MALDEPLPTVPFLRLVSKARVSRETDGIRLDGRVLVAGEDGHASSAGSSAIALVGAPRGGRNLAGTIEAHVFSDVRTEWGVLQVF